jgi:hypothetical protein
VQKKTLTQNDKNSDSMSQKTVTHESPQYLDNNIAPKGANIIRERKASLRSPSHSGARAFKGGAPSEEKKDHPPKSEARAVVELPGDRFAELEALWQRPWPDDEREARKAFVEACLYAEPEEIIAAAHGWVERFRDAPRFLPALPKWLAAKGWTKSPPKQKRTGKHRSLGDAMLEAAERKAAEEAQGVVHYHHKGNRGSLP